MAAFPPVTRGDDRGLARIRLDHGSHGLGRDEWHVTGHHQDRVALRLRYAFLYRAEHPARWVRVLDGTHARVEHRVDIALELGAGILPDHHDHLGDAAI